MVVFDLDYPKKYQQYVITLLTYLALYEELDRISRVSYIYIYIPSLFQYLWL